MKANNRRLIKDFRYSFSRSTALAFIASFILIFFSESVLINGFSYYNMGYDLYDACLTGWCSYALGIMGAVFGFLQFSFLFSKKQSDMLLSCGISRGRVFFNRALSGVITLAALSFILEILDLINNIKPSRGLALHFAVSLFAIFISRFCTMLFGFACAGLACVFGRGKVKKVICALLLMLIVPLCIQSAIGICDMFDCGICGKLKYGSSFECFTPFSGFAYDYNSLYDLCSEPKNAAVDLSRYALPLVSRILWCAVSCLILFVSKKGFSKVTAPCAGAKSNRFTETVLYFGLQSVIVYFAVGMFDYYNIENYFYNFSDTLSSLSDYFYRQYTAIVFVCAAVLSLILLIVALKVFKIKKQSLFVSLAAAVAVCCAGIAAGATGRFGAYRALPDIENVQSAEIVSYSNAFYPGCGTVWSDKVIPGRNENNFCEDEGKQAVIALHKELLSLQKKPRFLPCGNTDTDIYVSYELKDGTVIEREYSFDSYEFYRKIFALYDLKEQKENLLDFLSWHIFSEPETVENFLTAESSGGIASLPKEAEICVNRIVIVSNSQKKSCIPDIDDGDIKAFADIIFGEYTELSFEDIFVSGKKPLFFVSFRDEMEYNSFSKVGMDYDFYSLSLPVYDNMTKTLDALKNFNVTLPDDKTEKIKKISVFDYKKLTSAEHRPDDAMPVSGFLPAERAYILRTLKAETAFYGVNESYYFGDFQPSKYDYTLFYEHASDYPELYRKYDFRMVSGLPFEDEETGDEPEDENYEVVAEELRRFLCEPERVVTDEKGIKALYEKCLPLALVPENAELALVEFSDGTSYGYVLAK